MSARNRLGATFGSIAALVAVAAATALFLPPLAAAAPQPIGLHVAGGEEAWRPEPTFSLFWDNPPGVAAVHYRLLGPGGSPVSTEKRLDWPATAIQLTVPLAPGAYTAEVWLEDGEGAAGPAATASLRFDNAAPGRIEPAPIVEWIGRTAFPYAVQLSHPPGPLPSSGIRGYAVSIDNTASGSPCPGRVCDEDEVDLRGGVDDDRVAIEEIPEGTHFLHAVAVSGAGVRSSTPSAVVLKVDKTDPSVRLDGVPTGWASGPVALTANAADGTSGMARAGGGPAPFTAIRVDDAPPVLAPGGTVSAIVIGSGVHAVSYYARDAAGNVADGGKANGQPNHSPAAALVKIDGDPPRIAFAGAQDPRDPERIEVHAADGLSGLDLSRAEIAVRPAGSGRRFSALPTEGTGGTLRARWDSEAYPPGEYEFRAVAYDLAGNQASTTGRAGGRPMRLRAPLKAKTKLVARLEPRSLAYGHGAWLSGRLIVGRRAPLAGAAVRVVERFDTGAAPPERVSITASGDDGAFRVRLAPGPGREVLVTTPATATTLGATTEPLRLETSGRLRLHVSAPVARIGGRPIIFTGKVGALGAKVPAEGKTIELQFRLPGLPWQEFRTLRTNPHGHFRYPYRFTDDDSRGATFQFRAVAPAQANWPFESVSSRTVTVTGA